MVLLNLDAGEYPDEPEELWGLADVLSIACGGHAGDERSMERVVAFCAAHGRGIGAHPSYPDREGFGRRSLAIDARALNAALRAQCRSLAQVAAAHGKHVGWVKPHGALYHDAARDPTIAVAVVVAAHMALGTEVVVIGPPTGMLRKAAEEAHHAYLGEGFADRAIRPDGTLVPRSEPGALVTDPMMATLRAVELLGRVDTICVHADTPNALAIARAVREVLDASKASDG